MKLLIRLLKNGCESLQEIASLLGETTAETKIALTKLKETYGIKMNDLFADVGYVSLNHVGEELCGDMVEIVRHEDELIVVLADGLGSGVKANILSTLTSRIISTMMAENMSIDECVSTVAATLPVCKKRGVAYSTFTTMRFTGNTEAEIIQFDNPLVILLRKGKNCEYPMTERIIEGKKIFMRLKYPLSLTTFL